MIERNTIHEPTDIVMHCGTNDIDENSAETTASEIMNAAARATDKYQCQVYVSKLLPRKDELNKKAQHTNNQLIDQLAGQRFPNIKIIHHENISTRHLYDDKHLKYNSGRNDELSGAQLFASNMYQAVYKQTAPDHVLMSSRRWVMGGPNIQRGQHG
jgi:hypothetical protein